VALKVQKSASHYLEAAYDEVEILDIIGNKFNCPEWLKSLKGGYLSEEEIQSK
jgi:serine/threonine-protein kinase SRPK3